MLKEALEAFRDIVAAGQKIDMTPDHLATISLPGGERKIISTLPFVRDREEYERAKRLRDASGPDQRTGTATHQTLDSLIDHAKRFKAPESALWADSDERQLSTVFDYHEGATGGKPRWGKHRGLYTFVTSDAWDAWGGEDGLNLDQDKFAALLDARDRELASGTLSTSEGKKEAPLPSTLLTLANNLEVYSTSRAKRERDTTGRVKVSFTQDSGVSADYVIPQAFLIKIPIFQGEQPRELEVRLRVTVSKEGAAMFAVQIHAAADVLRETFVELCAHASSETGIPLFVGVPEPT